MEDLVSFLKDAGVPHWAIVLIVAGLVVAGPIISAIRRTRHVPTLSDRLADMQEELRERTDQLLQSMQAQVDEAKADAAEARREAAAAHAATEECEARSERLAARVTELERLIPAEAAT